MLKPSPNPIITNEMEEDLLLWIIGVHINVVTVSRYMIIMKGNEIYRSVYGKASSTGFLGQGLIFRFMNRHIFLTLQSSKIIKIVH